MAIHRQTEIDGEFFTPRSYQLELVDKSKNSNIIVPLGTGTGKTFIAVMLIKELAGQIRKPIEQGGKRTFFLVDKVPLVMQQAEQIRRHVNVTVGEHHGWRNLDIWTKDRWKEELREHQVMVMTAQIFYDLLNHGFFSLEHANLLIFDECHHATKNHPYRQIMKHYIHDTPPEKRPKVLGLTASIVNERCEPKKLEDVMQRLELALCARIETSSDLMSVAKYGAKPKIKVVKCQDYELNSSPLLISVEKTLENALRFCKGANFNPDLDIDPTKPLIESLSKTLAVLNQLGPYCTWKVCRLQEKNLEKLEKFAINEDQTLFIRMGLTALQTAHKILNPKMKDVRSLKDALPYLPSRLVRLLDVLKFEGKEIEKERKLNATKIVEETVNKKADVSEFSGIIFVEQRYIAYVLRLFLKDAKRWDKESYGFLKPDYVVGYSGYNLSPDDQLALHRRQEDVLKNFRQMKLNLLCATSVLEEGVDVRQCNVVIRYDPPKDFRSYVQSKGRARKQNSRYYILVETKFMDAMVMSLKQFQEIEEVLLKHCHSRDDPDADVIIPDEADQLMPPYYPPISSTSTVAGRPRVSMSTAIALINRYCAKLPSDIFTRLVPRSTIKEIEEDGRTFYQAKLLLPINSPLKMEIEGPKMTSKKYAQMAVALEVCKVLHEKRELDDHLLPVGKESAAEALEFLIGDDDDEVWPEDGRARPGSTKRKQYYNKKIADAFIEAKPEPDIELYLHLIDFKLSSSPASQNLLISATTNKNRQIVDPSESLRCFGILSKKPLPHVPGFPLYTRQGEILCRVYTLPNRIIVEPGQMIMIARFHQYIFSDILRLDKSSMSWDPNVSKSTVFVVPLQRTVANSFELDYSFVCDITLTISELPRQLTEDEREKFEFVRERYVDSVVMPWYRNSEQPHYYYVAEISQYFTPSCAFPDNMFASFNDYFMQKYGLVIYNQKQNLLDVDYTSNRLNLLIPRYVNRRGQMLQPSETRCAPTAYNQKQILVPELCDIHPIPGSMWNMIVCLPSVLYRLNALLVADELRRTILKEAFFETKLEAPESHFANLDYGWQKNLDAYVEMYRGDGTDLKYSVAESEEYEKNFQKPANSTGGDVTSTNGGFEIGVWDPSGLDFQDNDWKTDFDSAVIHIGNGPASSLTEPKTTPDTFAAVDNPIDEGSGDEWEAEEDIYFDMEFSRAVMKMERKPARAANGEILYNDPFKPDDNIVPTGWDSANNGPVVDGSNLLLPTGVEGVAGGLQFLSTGNDLLNAGALLEDIANVEYGGKPLTPLITNEAMEQNSVEPSMAPSKNIRLCERDREYDDVDHAKREETLDLNDLINFSEPLTPSVENISAANAAVNANVNDINDFAGFSIPTASAQLLDDFMDVTSDIKTFNESFSLPFSFETDVRSSNKFGPSPCLILNALTMTNASDGINLERLETVGDSFLKYAVTMHLFANYGHMHEGKLSFLRSKQVSNFNLYKLGKKKGIGDFMVASKFEPNDNWLPPGYLPLEKLEAPLNLATEEDDRLAEAVLEIEPSTASATAADGTPMIVELLKPPGTTWVNDTTAVIPYNLLTQHSIPDKSVADAVEALIGVYLLTYGPKGALQFMKWLGLKILNEGNDYFKPPESPLLHFIADPRAQLCDMWRKFQFAKLEETIGYRFNDKAYVIQAFTHASYFYNRITDCYQRLEFLGDAVLDYLITRHLYEDKRQHSPGVLTDLRSALVNNTIFASLAVKYEFHKYFMAICPGLHMIIAKFVKMQEERHFEANFDEELYLLNEEDCDDEEDIEVPKSLGDVFESVAGAVYLDSGCSLDAVWKVYYALMKDQIEKCCANPPKSPIRELLEMEPEKVKFAKLERIITENKVRVTVDVYGKGRFTGMGRNYRIAKCTAAKRALKFLKNAKLNVASAQVL